MQYTNTALPMQYTDVAGPGEHADRRPVPAGVDEGVVAW